MYFYFFFSSRRRHTRCLSDWSSDVCSSDLRHAGFLDDVQARHPGADRLREPDTAPDGPLRQLGAVGWKKNMRSEERRVGKECRSGWSPDHYKKQKHNTLGQHIQ